MIGKRSEIAGQTFNNLEVLYLHPKKTSRGELRWVCRCVCGKETVVTGSKLRNNVTKSCGCKNKTSRKHGYARTDIYWVWQNMKNRCYYKKAQNYERYGGRGIRVCTEWLEAKEFIGWALSHGYAKGLQIDRIDNDGDYTPENCRFVTPQENCKNRRPRKR